jgi:anti-sigma factor RsiW
MPSLHDRRPKQKAKAQLKVVTPTTEKRTVALRRSPNAVRVFLIDSLHASLTFVGRASLRNWRGSVLSEREFRPAIEASVSDGQVDKAGREGHAKAGSDSD